MWHVITKIGRVSSPLCVLKLERVCSQTQLCQLRCFNDYSRQLQSGPKKCIHSLLINIFGINLNEISISGWECNVFSTNGTGALIIFAQQMAQALLAGADVLKCIHTCAICWENIILHSHPEIEISFKFIPKILMSKECIHFFGPLCTCFSPYWPSSGCLQENLRSHIVGP